MKIKDFFTSQFYRYYFYKIKRERLQDYIFLDWKILIILLLIFLSGILLYFPYKIDLTIPVLSNQIYILESIFRIISILIAITFSFIILSFNVANRYFGRYAFLDFFKTNNTRFCITILISTIVLLLYSISFMKETNAENSYTNFLYFFSLSISTLSFLSIFPFFIGILRNAQSRNNIVKIFGKINNEWLENKFVAEIENDKISFYHKDPIVILNEIGLTAIKEFDHISIEVILSNILITLKNTNNAKIKDNNIVRTSDLYYKFNDLLSNYYQLAIKERNETHSNLIVRTRFDIEDYILSNIGSDEFSEFVDYKKEYRHWDLNFTIGSFFKKAIQFNEYEVCDRIIENYSTFISKAMIKLYPKNIDYSKEEHWDIAMKSEIIFEPLRIISKISKIISSTDNLKLFEKIFTVFYVVEETILKIETTDKTRCFLFNVIINYKNDIFNKYINSSSNQYLESSYFPYQNTIYFYEETKCTVLFKNLLNILDVIFSSSQLNNIILNNVKAEMLHLIRLGVEHKHLLFKAIEKFESISNKIFEEDNSYKKDIYLRLIENLKIVRSVATESKIDKSVVDRLDKSISSFTFEEEFSKELKNIGYISDERMI